MRRYTTALVISLLSLACASLYAQQQVTINNGVVSINASGQSRAFIVNLNQNVTSFSLSSPGEPSTIAVTFVENSTGGYTVSGWASNILNTSSISIATAPNASTTVNFLYDQPSLTWISFGGGGGGGGSSPPAYIAGTAAYNYSTSNPLGLSVTLGASVPAGTLVILWEDNDNQTGGDVVSAQDSFGDVPVGIGGKLGYCGASNTGDYARVYYFITSQPGSPTFTVTLSAAPFSSFFIMAAAYNATGVGAVSNAVFSGANPSMSLSTIYNNSLVVGIYGGCGQTTPTAGSGFTLQFTAGGGAVQMPVGIETAASSAVHTLTVPWTDSDTGHSGLWGIELYGGVPNPVRAIDTTSNFYMSDDMCYAIPSSVTSPAVIGNLLATFQGSLGYGTPDANHPCVLELSTGATANNYASLRIGNPNGSGTARYPFPAVGSVQFDSTFIWRISTTSNLDIEAGWITASSFVEFRYDTATSPFTTDWYYSVSPDGTSVTNVDSGIAPVVGDWVKGRIRSITPGTILFSICQSPSPAGCTLGPETAISTNVPTTGTAEPEFFIQTHAASSAYFDASWWSASIPLAR